MKRAVPVAVVLLLAACASGNNNKNAKILEPDVSFVQLIGPSEMNYPTGNVEVKFGIQIINKSSEPITLRAIDISSMGAGGAYEIRRERFTYNTTIPGQKVASLERWVKAYAYGPQTAIQNAPVTVRAILLFDSPSGSLQKVVVQNIGQYPGSSPG